MQSLPNRGHRAGSEERDQEAFLQHNNETGYEGRPNERGCRITRGTHSEKLQEQPGEGYFLQGRSVQPGSARGRRKARSDGPGDGTVQDAFERERNRQADDIGSRDRGQIRFLYQKRVRRTGSSGGAAAGVVELDELEKLFVQLRRQADEGESRQIGGGDGGGSGEDCYSRHRHFRSHAEVSGLRYFDDEEDVGRRVGWRVSQTAHLDLLRGELLRQLQGDDQKPGEADREQFGEQPESSEQQYGV